MGSQELLPVATVDELLKALSVLSRVVDHILQTCAVNAAVSKPISSSKVQVLRLLSHHGAQTSSQVARFLGVTRPTVSQIIDSMVHSALVKQRPASHDRREVVLELTRRGKQEFGAVRREQRHLLRSAVRLSERGDADQWIETAHQIARALTRADRAFKHFCLQCGAYTDGSCVLVGGDADCLFLQHRETSSKRPKHKQPTR